MLLVRGDDALLGSESTNSVHVSETTEHPMGPSATKREILGPVRAYLRT